MRGLSVLLFVAGVAIASAQVETCPTDQETDWSSVKLMRHEDCDKFYKCTYGEPIPLECPFDLYFNLELRGCDWRENVDCEGRNDPAKTTPEPVTTPESQKPTPKPTTPKPTPAPTAAPTTESHGCEIEVWPEPQPQPKPPKEELLANGCPVDPHVHRLLPHPDECTLFYFCVHGNTVLSECPSALHFNPVIQMCDWPADAGCAVSVNKHQTERRRLLNQIFA